MTTWSNMNLQDSASPIMEQLIYFHDHALMIVVMILVAVSYMMIIIMVNKKINRFMLEGQMIEIAWTIAPAIILIFIAVPSLRLLYLMDEINNPSITLKTIGHQWYWSYEYSDFNKIEFDSYMIPQPDNKINEFRLLDVDNRATLPLNSFIRMIITAEDVLHSWTIPSLGIKADATPGRLNQTSFLINRPGVFYGQCSEICGANHSFMPIVIEGIPSNLFISWILKMSS
uniref:cytochrome c oxidase subunit II n=1 Tax=Anaplecta omei TaxID=2093429 RepID=UPI0022FDB066|nr:cytochrome c oxidase subunit II [Anaplecta omei]WAX39196.1 cytochrome c oxidase subunit II [Anaplecta omei]